MRKALIMHIIFPYTVTLRLALNYLYIINISTTRSYKEDVITGIAKYERVFATKSCWFHI